MRNALSRRMALHRPKPGELEALQDALAAAEGAGDEAETKRLALLIETHGLRTRAIPYIDPIDIRYRRYEPSPRPIAQAVMFCIMDVSGSMTEHMKDMAKRFFMLLYVFLQKRYKQVEVVFIRHTDEAKEVDEKTFFESRETGGTRVSSALQEALKIIEARYPVADWNIYIAQASDGDNENGDNDRATALMRDGLLPLSHGDVELGFGNFHLRTKEEADCAMLVKHRRNHHRVSKGRAILLVIDHLKQNAALFTHRLANLRSNFGMRIGAR